MPRPKKINNAGGQPAISVTKAETTPEAPQPTSLEKSNQHALASLITLIEKYTIHQGKGARELVYGVVSSSPEQLVNDVIDWVTHIKELENAFTLVDAVSNGEVSVRRVDGKWVQVARAYSAEEDATDIDGRC